MPCRARLGAVWEATVNSCCRKACLLSAAEQSLRQAWPPGHTHIAAGSPTAGVPGSPFDQHANPGGPQDSWENSPRGHPTKQSRQKSASNNTFPNRTSTRTRTSCESRTIALSPKTAFLSIHHTLIVHLLWQRPYVGLGPEQGG